MTEINLTQCPKCGYTQKEPMIVGGYYYLAGHNCLNGEFVSPRKIGDETKEEEDILKHIKEPSEKELLQSQTQLLQESSRLLKKIDSNIRFFFWLTIICLVIYFIYGLLGKI